MKLHNIFLAFIILNLNLNLLHSSVVINEVLYDPSGSDGGYEWIELYNSGEDTVDLTGWIIHKAGTEFTEVLSLPTCSIEPQEYFLIGDEYVTNADLIVDLSFQNGGSATDGIRLVSPDELYTDTILYDEPNTNLLPDDMSDPGLNFAPDVTGGHTLARVSDGVDSDNCELDWFDCEISTPGAANFYPIDLEISYVIVAENGANYEAYIGVKNLSTLAVDNSSSSLEIAVNNSFLTDLELPAISEGDSVEVSVDLGLFDSGYYTTYVELKCLSDNVLGNNFLSTSFLSGNSPLVINEVMFRPDEYSFEWIELYNISSCGYDVDNFEIIDASGAKILFSGYIESEGYLVVSENRDQLLLKYPEVDTQNVIQSDSWTSLNNSEETLILSDQFSTEFDMLEYFGSDCPVDKSLERINPFLESQPDNWGYSIDSATPGIKNSIFVTDLPRKSKLSISPGTFSPYRSERTIISYKLPEKLSRVTMRIFDLKGRLKRKLIDQQIQASEGEIIWDGNDGRSRSLPIGIYIILMEATSLETEKVYSEISTIIVGK